ncbi:hypothetical protein DRP04_05670 [Archaeoglobales archaeon]|nr:MAG: hypothetical protein DRP04_05670 [Archaeoglobales archaeon]
MTKGLYVEHQKKISFEDVLLDLLLKMNYAKAVNDESAYYSLIEHFEKLMIPYADTKFKEEIEKIDREYRYNGGSTPVEVASKRATIRKQKLDAKLGALLKLARRVGLLPAAKVPGRSNM